MSSADHYLIDRIRSGDADAWRKLVDRYQGRLVQFAKRRLHDASAAEDVAQETLIAFLQALPRYDASRSLETFLFAIAHNKLIDHFRRVGRRKDVEALVSESFAHTLADDATPAPSPSSWMMRQEHDQLEYAALVDVLRGFVQQFMNESRFQDLKVVELIFCAGKRNKEVAQLLGLDEKAVAGVKFRALKKMQDLARNVDPNHTLFPGLWG